MPVPRITKSQFKEKLRKALIARTSKYDTAFGPVNDLFLEAPSGILEDQNNNRLRKVSLAQSLQNVSELSDSDINAIIFNEGLRRPSGSRSTVTLYFQRFRPFTSAETGQIPVGFPVATAIDSSTGQLITFVTVETKDKSNISTVIDPDTNQIIYENSVAAMCLTAGSTGVVSAGRITRPLRSLVGYDAVINKSASSDGRDSFSNKECVDLYALAVASRQLAVPSGNEFYILDAFPNVEDAYEVSGTSTFLTRAGTDAGAVDVFIKGRTVTQQVDNLPFIGQSQKIILSQQPLIQVVSVVGSVTFEEGVDYEVVFDTTGYSGSIKGKDAVRFLPSMDISRVPAIGDTITITYTYNELIGTLQTNNTDPKVSVEGRDMLYRAAKQVEIYITATAKIFANFDPDTIKRFIRDALLEYINGTVDSTKQSATGLGLGNNVERFDLDGVISLISGTDNLTYSKLTRTITGAIVDDITIQPDEYAHLDLASLNIL